jgi:anaerobic magnesium-protoporphyrin IX monomethyl ester cyclase
MKILFTHSYFLRFDPKQWDTGQPYAPLGTLYAAACAREKGHEVFLFDTMFASSPDEVIPELDRIRPDLLVIYDDGFNYLTKMCLTNMREAALVMIQHAAVRSIPSLVSSSDSTDHPEIYLSAGARAIIKGEGEITLVETLAAMQEGNSLEKIPGLFIKDNLPSSVAVAIAIPLPSSGLPLSSFIPRALIRDLDSLPLPAWDLVNIVPYKKMWLRSSGYFSINMGTTRGCPFKCNWCAKPIYGNRYHSHSPERIVREMELLQNKFQPDHIWFCDDIFGLKPGWVAKFSSLLREKGIKIPYKIQSRVDLLLEDNQIKPLADSGCQTVWMGAESGSQAILDAMDKGTKVEQIYAAAKKLKEHGIKASFFLQFGYPGETIQDIHLTMKMLKDLVPDDIGVSISYPLPGTVFYENVKSQLTEKQNWSDSDDLAMMFRHTYEPKFYKDLHRFVHLNYRTYQGIHTLRDFIRRPFSVNRTALKRMAATMYYAPSAYLSGKRLGI